MKYIIHSYFLLESDFEITFKKVEKSAFENFIFERCVEKHTLPVLKGLTKLRRLFIHLNIRFFPSLKKTMPTFLYLQLLNFVKFSYT